MNQRDGLFYGRWILANAVAEGIGLSLALLTASLASRMVWPEPSRTSVFGALLLVILGALIQGTLVGYAQAQVLVTRLHQLPVHRWAWATVTGAAIAWALGLLPAVIVDLLDSRATMNPPGRAPMLLGAALSGGVLGVVLALPQWLVLRRFAKHAWWWLPASAVGWAVGMAIVFAGIDRLAWTGGLAGVIDGVFLVCAAAGAAVAAVHGWVLQRLLSSSAVDDAKSSATSSSARSALHR
jgi:hypothetical protein